MKQPQFFKRLLTLALLLGLTALLVGQPVMVGAQSEECLDSADIVCVAADGDVGIGTTRDYGKGKLEVMGAIHTDGPNGGLSFQTREAGGRQWVWYASDLNARLWSGTDKLIITPDGELRVVGPVTAGGPDGGFSFENQEAVPNARRWEWYASENVARLWSGDDKLVVTPDGDVGIGTTSPSRGKLHVVGRVTAGGPDGGFSFDNREVIPNARRWEWYASDNTARLWSGDDKLVINKDGDVTVAGTTTTSVLQITGGMDLAEPFAMTDADAIEPGMVVAIDPDNPGQLRLADSAYDRGVAGIVSGAGGINPGITLQQEGTLAVGDHPVSLSGRVYVWADASYGPIQPTDLLTSSDTSGYAMKVTDYKHAHGAIIGKAMTGLEEGKGLVLVLVTLH